MRAAVVQRAGAPIGALVIAVGITSAVLAVSGRSPVDAFGAMARFGARPDSLAEILNKATDYYLAAVAVAIGFRMNLFNIGVDGQYRLAALLAAALGAAPWLGWLPGPARLLLVVVTAMIVGALWAGIAGLLKAARGVSEVISTIMLNVIAGAVVAYLLTTERLAVQPEGSNNVSTRLLPADAWMPGIPLVPGADNVNGFVLVAAAAGLGYWYLLGRTRFGYDLRAAGLNPAAAVAAGVDTKRMTVAVMLLSGAVAGLVGMPQLLGQAHAYTADFGGIGLTAIGIALLGRNHPVGIAAAALLWGFLDRSALILDLEDIPKEIVTIMQGIVVLAVVIAYAVAGRLAARAERRRAGAATGAALTGVAR